MPIIAARACCSARCSARSTACSSPCSGCRRWPSRSARSRSTAGWRTSCSATGRSPTTRSPGRRTRSRRSRGTVDPVRSCSSSPRWRSCSACVLHATPIGRGALRDRQQRRGGRAFAGIAVAAHQVLAVRRHRRDVARWPACFWTLRFASARADNAHRPGAGGRRRGAARRRLDLRRPRRPARRARRVLLLGVAAQRAAPGRRAGQRAHHRHRALLIALRRRARTSSRIAARAAAPAPTPRTTASPTADTVMRIRRTRVDRDGRRRVAGRRARRVLAVAACGGTAGDDARPAPAPATPATRRPGRADQGGPEDRLPAQAGEQPVLRHVDDKRRQGRGRGVQGRVQARPARPRPAPSAQVSYINTLSSSSTDVIVVSANDKDADLRRAEPRPRQAGAKVVTFDSDTKPECRDAVHQPGHRRGHRQDADQADLGRGRRGRRRDRDPVGDGERDEPERLDRDDEDRAGQAGVQQAQAGRRPSTATTTTRSRSRRRRACWPSTRTSRASSRRPPSASRRPPGTCPARTYKGKVAADRSRHAEPDARVRQGRHGQGVRAVEPGRPRLPGRVRRRARWPPGMITGKEGDKFKAGKLGEYTVGTDGAVVLGDAVHVQRRQHRPVQLLSRPGGHGVRRICFTPPGQADRLDEYRRRHARGLAGDAGRAARRRLARLLAVPARRRPARRLPR